MGLQEEMLLQNETVVDKALAVLFHALDRCNFADMRTPEVFAAMDTLAATGAASVWQLHQFQRALNRFAS